VCVRARDAGSREVAELHGVLARHMPTVTKQLDAAQLAEQMIEGHRLLVYAVGDAAQEATAPARYRTFFTCADPRSAV
jgi:hypothetical protein